MGAMREQGTESGGGMDPTRRGLLRAALGGAFLAAGAGGMAGETADDAGGPMDVYNVRRFGAKGDGTSDDTPALQAAVAAALKAGGGRVHVPSGRYRVTRPLAFRSLERIALTGDGPSSVLLHEATDPLLLWPEGVSCREVSVRHLCITAAKADKPAGVAAIACLGGTERTTFAHLLFNAEGARMGGGIRVETVMDTTTLDHCLMWGPVYGTGVRVARGSEVRIFGGRILGAVDPYKGLNAGNIGIHLTGNNGGVHIVTTDIIGLHTGLKIGDPGAPSNREVFITHATFDSSVHGIWQSDGAFTSIAGCWAASSDEDQVLLDEHAEHAILTVAGGTIFNGGAYGRPGGHNGMVVRAGTFTLSGVAIRHNKGTGLLVGPKARDYAVSGCRFTDNGAGAVLDGSGYAVSGCVFARNGENLKDLGRSPKHVAGNVVQATTPTGA